MWGLALLRTSGGHDRVDSPLMKARRLSQSCQGADWPRLQYDSGGQAVSAHLGEEATFTRPRHRLGRRL